MPCLPVREITDDDLARMQKMLELMYSLQGIGLAGPQAGWGSQVVTIDAVGERQGERIFINPRIISTEGEVEDEEGCLSIPGIRAQIRRAQRVVVAAYTVRGERTEQAVEGLAARAWQHEIDHLKGILFIDRLDPTTLMGLRQGLKELEKAAAEPARRRSGRGA